LFRIGVVLWLLVLAGALGAWLVMHLTGTVWNMIDLSVYQWGGERVRAGSGLYSMVWTGDRITGYRGSDLPFTYTPAAALLFVPASFLSLTVAQVLLLLVDAVAIAVVIAVVLRATGHEAGRGRTGLVLVLTACALVLEPVVHTISLGQINLVLLAVCVVDLLLPDDHRFKGVGIGLATAVKLTPAIFIPYLLVTGQWRPALRAGAVAAGVTALGFAVLPGPSADYWFGRLFLDASRVGAVDYVGNQSLNGLVIRATGTGVRESVPGVILLVVVGAVGLVAARRLHQRGSVVPAIVVVALTGLLISPISWSHHWVWIIPAGVLLVDAAHRRRPYAAALLAAGLVMFAALPGIIWWMPQDGGIERTWNPAQQVAGNLYVWVGLAVLAAVVLTEDPRVRRSLAARRPLSVTVHRARQETMDGDARVGISTNAVEPRCLPEALDPTSSPSGTPAVSAAGALVAHPKAAPA
jgi:alpha-1,2-mannosyltransferase